MVIKTTKIIKASKTTASGKILIGPGAVACSGHKEGSFAHPRQARIVSNDGNSALIEVCCSCGERFYLNCSYADMAGTV